ncbi:hypothetical protein DPMN_017177 [Dreissena polymorpha]|uniref:Uncharacterized protein n=1 Tax=Dreissena polymorpha TaxID=45954 RepID=A0A9D4S770_DREPO|nr:hypothetical protein DPMN_017177 [Dreissena polymorpha]
MQSVIRLHATEAAAVIDIYVILPDKIWLVILDWTAIPSTGTSTQTGVRSIQELKFYFHCTLNNYSNHSHFHLDKLDVSTCLAAG